MNKVKDFYFKIINKNGKFKKKVLNMFYYLKKVKKWK